MLSAAIGALLGHIGYWFESAALHVTEFRPHGHRRAPAYRIESAVDVLVRGPPVRDRDPQHRLSVPRRRCHPCGAVAEQPSGHLTRHLIASE